MSFNLYHLSYAVCCIRLHVFDCMRVTADLSPCSPIEYVEELRWRPSETRITNMAHIGYHGGKIVLRVDLLDN